MDDLREKALSALLDRNKSDDAAWQALEANGWTHLLADLPPWTHLDDAVVATLTLASARRDVGLLAHLAASCSLANSSLEMPARLGLGVDALRRNDALEYNRLGTGPVDAVVVGPVDGQLVLAQPGEEISVTQDLPAALDAIRSIKRVAVPDSTTTLLTDSPEQVALHEALAALLVVADALGIAKWAVDQTIAHVQSRQVFGEALSTRQVVRHRLVDMTSILHNTQALVEQAAASSDVSGLWRAAWLAKCQAGQDLPWVTDQAVQLHGGMGFAWDSGIHFAFRRARAIRSLLGGPERAAHEVYDMILGGEWPNVTDWSRR